jgi:hypothetical protein
MRIKGSLSKVLLIAFAVSLIPVTAFSAPKITPGSTCKVLNQKVIYQNKTYTCIKSGKKLLWNKGVSVKKPTPTPTPTPTPIPTPTPTPTIQAEVAVGKWQETQFALVQAMSLLKPAVTQKLNFVYSPSVNKTEADKLQASYQEPISFLSNLYVNPSPVTFLVFDETERDWWWSQATKLATKMPDDWWGGSHCQPNPMSHCGYGSMAEPDGTFHFGQLLGSQFLWKQRDYTIAYHESIHVYQLGLLGNRMNALPTWFAEGQATYLGYAFSHKYWNSNSQRADTLRGLKSAFPELAKFNNSEWIEWIKKVDSNFEFTFNNGLGYSIGELILEALYNSNEYQKIHSWMVAIKDGDTYKESFKKVFSEDYDEWLQTVAVPYLDSQI